jgi:hypothetical protein
MPRNTIDVNKYTYRIPLCMNYAALIVAGLVFLLAYQSHDIQKLRLEDNFVFTYVAYGIYQLTPIGVGILIVSMLLLYLCICLMAHEGLIAMGHEHTPSNLYREHLTHKELKRIFFVLAISTTIFLIAAYFMGEAAQSYFSTGRIKKMGSPLPGLAYITLYHVVPALLAWWLVRWLPMVVAGWSIARTQHPAKAPIERSVGHRQADHVIAKELATVLRAQELDDARALALFKRLSPWRKKLWQAQYAKRTREAVQLRELVKAQEKVMREEASLAHDVVSMERTRRATYSR